MLVLSVDSIIGLSVIDCNRFGFVCKLLSWAVFLLGLRSIMRLCFAEWQYVSIERIDYDNY